MWGRGPAQRKNNKKKIHIHVSVSDLYIPRIGLPILLQQNRQTNARNI